MLEKTPNNCFRVDFIDAIFPTAFYIFLTRDPRTQVTSLEEMKSKGPSPERLVERALSTRPQEYPSMLSRLPWLLNQGVGQASLSWGVRPPGWYAAVGRDDYPLIQWLSSMYWAVRSLKKIDKQRVIQFKYEEFSLEPENYLRALEERIGEDLSESIALARRERKPIRTNVDASLPSYVISMLSQLGYSA